LCLPSHQLNSPDFIQNVPAFQQLCEIKYPIIVSDPEFRPGKLCGIIFVPVYMYLFVRKSFNGNNEQTFRDSQLILRENKKETKGFSQR